MNAEKLTQKSAEAIRNAQALAMEYGNPQIEQVHLLAALLADETGLIPQLLSGMGVTLPSLNAAVKDLLERQPRVSSGGREAGKVYISVDTDKTLNRAEKAADEMKDEFISVEHLFLALLDTAGRLHVDEALMEELQNIKAAVSPNEIILVVDAMIGQDAVNAAKAFDEALDITGVMLTKLDGDARGGAALSIKAVTGKPIKFAGVGEKLDQIEVFHPDRMASRILGMGDVLSLIEKAQQNFDQKKALELQEKLRKNKFTLADYYDQLVQLKGMGSLQDIAGMIPGVDAKALEGANFDEKALTRTEAIILAMTPYERENPEVLNSSRKKRIAAGSGTQVVDVNRLLKQFNMMQQMTKQMAGMGKKVKRMGGMFGKRKGLPF